MDEIAILVFLIVLGVFLIISERKQRLKPPVSLPHKILVYK